MVKVSKAQSEHNKTEIRKAAGVVIRRDGLEAASVAAIAKHANLTHGAIYSHYGSKEAIAVDAITADFQRIIDMLEKLLTDGAPSAVYVDAYLADDHRDYFIWGCPAGALASEMHRHSPLVQNAFAEGLAKNLEVLAKLLCRGGEVTAADSEIAMAILSALTGALSLARAVKVVNPKLAGQIMLSTKNVLLDVTFEQTARESA
jgi:TetR/AcrR family transcriptional regulator, transcriptional repressor for nem operon